MRYTTYYININFIYQYGIGNRKILVIDWIY